MVVRSSLHRTKYARGRPTARKPDVERELPLALRAEEILAYDPAYNLAPLVAELVARV